MMINRHVCIVSAMLLCSIPSIAQEFDVRTQCNTEPALCLVEIQTLLTQVAPQSFQYYEYQVIHMDTLFSLAQFETLYELTSQFVAQESLPPYFKIHAYIYHTKMLQVLKKEEESKRFRVEAEQLLNEVNKNFSDPISLVKLLNLQLYSDIDPRIPYRMLKGLAQKFQRRQLPEFKYELFLNLGHFAERVGETKQAINYRAQAVHFAHLLNSQFKLGESLFNLARSYSNHQDHQQAYQAFADSLEAARLADDQIGANLAILYLAKESLALGQHSQAKEWFKQLDNMEVLPPLRQALYLQLPQQLN